MLTTQNYELYTAEQQAVWSLLFERQWARLEGRVCPEYRPALAAIGLDGRAIPRFEELNERLQGETGWRLTAVNGALSSRDFFSLLDQRLFPSATTMRGMDELAHSKLPDMFHDLFGHVPLLAVPIYSDFLLRMSRLGMRYIDDEDAILRLGWAYKWTVEYGLMQPAAEAPVVVYGAGLISSSEELEYVLSPAPGKRAFTPRDVMFSAHKPASLQPSYFVIRSFSQLVESVAEMEEILREGRARAAGS